MSRRRRVHLESLLSRKVHDVEGRHVGRIEEVRAELASDGACVVTDYELGRQGLLDRIGATTLLRALLAPLGTTKSGDQPLRVPWQQMDLTDPARPKLRCTIDQLKTK